MTIGILIGILNLSTHPGSVAVCLACNDLILSWPTNYKLCILQVQSQDLLRISYQIGFAGSLVVVQVTIAMHTVCLHALTVVQLGGGSLD